MRTWTTREFDEVKISGERRLNEDGQQIPCLEISVDLWRAEKLAERFETLSKIGDLVEAEDLDEMELAKAVRQGVKALRTQREAELFELLSDAIQHRKAQPDDEAGYEHRLRAFAVENGDQGTVEQYRGCLEALGVAPDHANAEATTLHDHAMALLGKRKPERPPTLREILQKQRSERPASGAIGGRAEPANGGPNGVGDGENGKRESPAGDHEGSAGVGRADR